MLESEFLTKAKSLIDSPGKWCRGHMAITLRGEPISYESVKAVSFCSGGAVHRTALILYRNRSKPMYKSIHSALDCLRRNLPPGTCITIFNDTHTHAEVMALWDKAIAETKHLEATPVTN